VVVFENEKAEYRPLPFSLTYHIGGTTTLWLRVA